MSGLESLDELAQDVELAYEEECRMTDMNAPQQAHGSFTDEDEESVVQNTELETSHLRTSGADLGLRFLSSCFLHDDS